MLPSMMSQQFTRKRYPLILQHGSMVRDLTGTPVTADMRGSIQPGAGTTDVVNRNGAEIVFQVFAHPNYDIAHDDIVTVYGDDYFVNGPPQVWGTGILNHQVVNLSRWVE